MLLHGSTHLLASPLPSACKGLGLSEAEGVRVNQDRPPGLPTSRLKSGALVGIVGDRFVELCEFEDLLVMLAQSDGQ